MGDFLPDFLVEEVFFGEIVKVDQRPVLLLVEVLQVLLFFVEELVNDVISDFLIGLELDVGGTFGYHFFGFLNFGRNDFHGRSEENMIPFRLLCVLQLFHHFHQLVLVERQDRLRSHPYYPAALVIFQ